MLLPRTDVLVTNGGYGGVQQALAHGVPLVVAGRTEDKVEVAARVVPTLTAYRPGRSAKKVVSPILFCVCDTDSVTPPAETLAYARTAPKGEVKTYAAGHFDIYLGDAFEAVVVDQVEFLTRHLKAR